MHFPSFPAWLLLALPLLPQQSPAQDPGDPRAELRALKRDLNQALTAWREDARKKMEAAAQRGGVMPAFSMQPPTGKFITSAQRYAKNYRGTEAEIGFLKFIVSYATIERDAVESAVETLTGSHARSEAITKVLPILQDRAGSIDTAAVFSLFDAVIAENEDADALAQAHISRGALRLSLAKSDADRRAAKADLNKVAKITDDEDWIAEAETILFDAEHLQPGCKAPDIEGQDTDGVAFKLSDYRGKVILLDFWGFW